jgi:SanA protein
LHIKKLSVVLAKIAAGLFLAGAIALGGTRLAASIYARSRMVTPATAGPARVAIVFGAGLSRDGSPSPVLRDRVIAAAGLYFAGKVRKLLLSGDNRFIDYNEPGAMHAFALKLGVPDQDIVLDYAGRRTYDTCYRAKAIFGVDQAILVTQAYHLPRALLLCNALGVQSTGLPADLHTYGRLAYLVWNLREYPAVFVSYWETWVTHPIPVLGSPEPIFPPPGAN